MEGLAAKEGLQGIAPGSLEGAADNMRDQGHYRLQGRDRDPALEEEEAAKLEALEEGKE